MLPRVESGGNGGLHDRPGRCVRKQRMRSVAQVVLARRQRAVKKVVFIREPAHNMENVIEADPASAIEGGIGHKNLVFSTVGTRSERSADAHGQVGAALSIGIQLRGSALELLPAGPACISLLTSWWNWAKTPARPPHQPTR